MQNLYQFLSHRKRTNLQIIRLLAIIIRKIYLFIWYTSSLMECNSQSSFSLLIHSVYRIENRIIQRTRNRCRIGWAPRLVELVSLLFSFRHSIARINCGNFRHWFVNSFVPVCFIFYHSSEGVLLHSCFFSLMILLLVVLFLLALILPAFRSISQSMET